jgi:Domain of unknown function (DUF397)
MQERKLRTAAVRRDNPSQESLCLEAMKLPGGRVALRQSTDPDSPALILEPDEIRAFVEGAKTGLADGLLS